MARELLLILDNEPHYFIDDCLASSRMMQVESRNSIEQDWDIDIFPIPAKSLLYVNGIIRPSTLVILSVEGQVISTQEVFNVNNALNLSNISNGMYFLEIKNSNKIVYKSKFSIVH